MDDIIEDEESKNNVVCQLQDVTKSFLGLPATPGNISDMKSAIEQRLDELYVVHDVSDVIYSITIN
jgi:hypothetical protein